MRDNPTRTAGAPCRPLRSPDKRRRSRALFQRLRPALKHLSQGRPETEPAGAGLGRRRRTGLCRVRWRRLGLLLRGIVSVEQAERLVMPLASACRAAITRIWPRGAGCWAARRRLGRRRMNARETADAGCARQRRANPMALPRQRLAATSTQAPLYIVNPATLADVPVPPCQWLVVDLDTNIAGYCALLRRWRGQNPVGTDACDMPSGRQALAWTALPAV
jgi:hypothetical protein